MASLQEVEAQQAELKANHKKRLAEIRAEKRNLAKRLRRLDSNKPLAVVLHDAGIQEECPRLSASQKAEVLMLLELTNPHCTDVAVSYALGQGREDQYRNSGLDERDPAVRQAIATALDILYEAVDLQLVVDALDGTEYLQKKLSRYVVEYKLFHWLVVQNCDKGVYPGSDLAYDAASRFVPEGAPQHVAAMMKKFFLSGSRAARYWLATFKARWGCEPGGQGAGEDMEPELLEQKVPRLFSGMFSPQRDSSLRSGFPYEACSGPKFRLKSGLKAWLIFVFFCSCLFGFPGPILGSRN
jgi:hypothetical protein